MINTPMRTSGSIDRNSLLSVNNRRVQAPFTSSSIQELNTNKQAAVSAAASRQQASPHQQAQTSQQIQAPIQLKIPPLINPVQKGQKIPLNSLSAVSRIKACLGWNTTNQQCDVDVSAFLLNENGKVPGDSWFVFYGQTASPDQSTSFEVDGTSDREIIHIDFTKLNPSVKKIVFVLTINEAAEKKLHFGMLKDAYVRILNESDGSELVGFQLTDYYSNIISMMIGEVYQHNGTWKFHAIGNGVARDLAGLCELYGVQVSS